MVAHNNKHLTFYDLIEKIGDCEQSHMHTMVTNISAMKTLQDRAFSMHHLFLHSI